MNNGISLAYLENALNFLRDVMNSPEKRAWCRDFGEEVPASFQEELGEFLLNYRDSGAEKVFGSARRTLDAEAEAAFPLREELSSMSDAELQGQLAGLMEADRPFVLYGISSGLLCRLYEELLLRTQKERQNGAAYRLTEADLPALEAFCERHFPGHGPEMARLFAGQLPDSDAALFGCRRGESLLGLAHARIRRDYVEGARECESGVAYLEGIWLEEEAPYAQNLIGAVSDWAKERGCQELAADCEISDAGGASLRNAAGFTEAARIICYIKEL